MTDVFREHEIQWTRELSARFWNFKARTNAPYFSNEVGSAVIRNARRAGVPMKGNVLDFGCGLGHLMSRLLNQGIACSGADFSADSVSETNAKLSSNPLFHGAQQIHGIPTHLKESEYDVIFCTETIEHILPDELPSTFCELKRLLRPGGYLVVSTPHDESLDDNKVLCPECGCIFHRVQHVHSWSVESIKKFMTSIGFKTHSCKAIHFDESGFWENMRRAVAFVHPTKKPNLLYIGTKP